MTGLGGLLNQLTKIVFETALEAELTEHLGHEHGGTPLTTHMRTGTGVKTVLTQIGPVQIEAPGDRDGSFEPVIVPKRQRRLDGVDQIVLSLTGRGLTTGWGPAHFDEVGLQRHHQSDQRKSRWGPPRMVLRPLDTLYPVVFVDAIRT